MRYLLSDGLGSVRQAVDETAQVVSYHEFDPYGNPIQNPKSQIQNRYAFTGEWWEDEVGLLYLRARWYSPETGTFLSVDPVESEPDYQYVHGNPVNLVDPSGMTPLPKNSCDKCPQKDKTDNGYSESVILSYSVLRPFILQGKEIVFDFATLQVAEFSVHTDMEIPPPALDLGVFTFLEKIYSVSFISGFEAESDRGDIEAEYIPHVVNYGYGVGAGPVIQVEAGGHYWEAVDGSLKGHGYWFGGEISLNPFDLMGLALIRFPVGPEVSIQKNFSEILYKGEFGDVCNPDDAQKFLNVLQTTPHPTILAGSLGMKPGRFVAIEKFKSYAGLN